MEKEREIHKNRNNKQNQNQQCNPVHPAAHRLQIFDQFLLLQGIAIGGFAHHLEVVFHPLQRRILIGQLILEVCLLKLQV